jgi:hypothetical protein
MGLSKASLSLRASHCEEVLTQYRSSRAGCLVFRDTSKGLRGSLSGQASSTLLLVEHAAEDAD